MHPAEHGRELNAKMWFLGQLFWDEPAGSKIGRRTLGILLALAAARDSHKFPSASVYVMTQAGRSLLRRRTIRRWATPPRVPFFYVKDLAIALIVFD